MKASHSRMATFRKCRRKYYWSYNLNRDTGSSVGQQVGTVGHSALALWYREYTNPERDKFAMQKATSMALDMGIPYDDIQRLERSLARYFETADDIDVVDVLSTEQHITKQLGKHTIEGYVDLIGLMPNGKRIAYEHKFNQRPSIENTGLDMQISMYMWLADVDSVMFNIINVTKAVNTKTAPIMREEVTRTKTHIDIFLQNLETQLDEMENFDSLEDVERFAYPNPTHECNWSCNFYQQCQEYQRTGDISVVLNIPPKVFTREIVE